MKEETYTKVHDLLMARMRRELRQKDLQEINAADGCAACVNATANASPPE